MAPVLGSHISWLSFPQNFSQKDYKQKFHLLEVKISGTICFLNSFYYSAVRILLDDVHTCHFTSTSFITMSPTPASPSISPFFPLALFHCLFSSKYSILSTLPLWYRSVSPFRYTSATSAQLHVSFSYWQILICGIQFTCIQLPPPHPILFQPIIHCAAISLFLNSIFSILSSGPILSRHLRPRLIIYANTTATAI